MLSLAIQIASGISASASAWCWLASARVDIPHPVIDSYSGEGPFATAIKRQTKPNVQAAGWAASTALLQAAAIVPK